MSEAVEKFIDASDWLSDEDAPAITSLRLAAITADSKGATPALLTALGQTYRHLLSRKPAEPEAVSQVDALIEAARTGE